MINVRVASAHMKESCSSLISVVAQPHSNLLFSWTADIPLSLANLALLNDDPDVSDILHTYTYTLGITVAMVAARSRGGGGVTIPFFILNVFAVPVQYQWPHTSKPTNQLHDGWPKSDSCSVLSLVEKCSWYKPRLVPT